MSAAAAEAEVRRRLAKEVERAEAPEAEAPELRERAEKLARALSRAQAKAAQEKAEDGAERRRANECEARAVAAGGQDSPR